VKVLQHQEQVKLRRLVITKDPFEMDTGTFNCRHTCYDGFYFSSGSHNASLAVLLILEPITAGGMTRRSRSGTAVVVAAVSVCC